MHKLPLSRLREINQELNQVSPSFCLAKWLQATVHLQNGFTHSCHHPPPHKIKLNELEYDHSALHNTHEKMLRRKEMLNGIRPSECEYCWAIEDASTENISDRTQKSSEDWSYYRLNEIASLSWDKKIPPAYLEVSFGNECNFKCAYCSPTVSSSIMNETLKYGPYTALPYFSLQEIERNEQTPIDQSMPNPYIHAFWKWWPDLKNELKIFRITGGEPLLNRNTYDFLDNLIQNPLENLSLSINSNLGVSDVQYAKFLEKIQHLISVKAVKSFSLYTSIDTYGKNAEFIRFGLDFKKFLNNVEVYLDQVKECELIFMCTYNIFSVVNFHSLLKEVLKLKKKYKTKQNTPRLLIDIPYLKDPVFLSAKQLPKNFHVHLVKNIQFMEKNSCEGDTILFYEHEISKMKRILRWLEQPQDKDHILKLRKDLISFVDEYQLRKQIQIKDYIPEYSDYLSFCRRL